MDQIIKNAIIIFKNGSKEVFNAISIDKKGVYTGHIIFDPEKEENIFVEHGFIPKEHIQKICSSCVEKQYHEIDQKEGKKEE